VQAVSRQYAHHTANGDQNYRVPRPHDEQLIFSTWVSQECGAITAAGKGDPYAVSILEPHIPSKAGTHWQGVWRHDLPQTIHLCKQGQSYAQKGYVFPVSVLHPLRFVAKNAPP